MGIIDLPEDLKPEVDAALRPDPATPGSRDYNIRVGATAQPVVPAQNVVPNPAPDVQPGSLADKISSAYLIHLAKNQPQRPQQPQSTGQRVVNAAEGVLSSLGDASHANDNPRGGWLSGVTSVLSERSARISGEQQRAFEQAEQKKRDDILLAHSQAETVALHRNFYQQDLEHRQQFHEGNQKYFNAYKASNDLEDGVSQEELYDRMKNDPKFAQNYLARATGETPVVDGNGQEQLERDSGRPVMKPTYTIMRIASKDGSDVTKTLDASDSAAYNKYLGLQYPEGTKLTMAQDNALSLKLAGVRDAASLINKANGKDLTPEQMDSARPLLSDPTVQHAVSAVPGSPYTGLLQAQSNADQHLDVIQQQLAVAKQQGNQQALVALTQQAAQVMEEKQKVQSALGMVVGDKQKTDYEKIHGDLDTRLGEMEKGVATIKSLDEATAMAAQTKDMMANKRFSEEQRARLAQIHQQATNAQKAMQKVKADELAAKKAESDFANSPVSGLTGEAYLKTLPQPHRDLLTSIAEGRNTKAAIQNRKGELTPLGLAVMQAFPDFDVQKAAKYGDTLKEYQSTKSGTAGGQLNSGATALKHLSRLKQINDENPIQVHNPSTAAYKEYNNLLDTVADELVTFYGEPKTNQTIDSKKSTLGGLMNRNAAIVEQAKAMASKFESFQQTWDNASPRPSYKPPMPNIDESAKKALTILHPEFVQTHPQFAPAGQQSQLPPAPTGKVSVQIPGSAPGFIPAGALAQFKKDHPNAVVGQ